VVPHGEIAGGRNVGVNLEDCEKVASCFRFSGQTSAKLVFFEFPGVSPVYITARMGINVVELLNNDE
jgi:hypothetical protein